VDRVAKGPTDGTQILMVPPQIAINQYLYAKLAYDPEKDLVPIAQVVSMPLCGRSSTSSGHALCARHPGRQRLPHRRLAG
jgi:hypothetical protein